MSREWGRQTSKGIDNSDLFESSGDEDGCSNSSNSGSRNFLLDADLDDEASSDGEVGFFVQVETIMGNTFQVYAYPSDTVELLKARIAFQEGIAQRDQNLFISKDKLPMDNPNSLLSDLGLNEFTSESTMVKLVPNLNTGVGPKGFIPMDLSPPPFTTALSSYPFTPSPEQEDDQSPDYAVKGRRGGPKDWIEKEEDLEAGEHFRLPRLGLSEDGVFDGVLVFKDKNEKRVYVILRKNSRERLDFVGSRGCFGSSSSSNSSAMSGSIPCRSGKSSNEIFNEGQRQMQRQRENAKTLQKMNEIKEFLHSRKVGVNEESGREKLPRPLPLLKPFPKSSVEGTSIHLHLPFIRSPGRSPKLEIGRRRAEEKSSRTSPRIEHGLSPFHRSMSLSNASLNRLKAEICLEGKKSGGGSFGILPYTYEQLVRYAQLKIKILLAEQAPNDWDETPTHRFKLRQEAKSIVPTVVRNRRMEAELLLPLEPSPVGISITGRRSTLRSANSYGTGRGDVKETIVGLLQESTLRRSARLAKARIKSDESLKSGRLKRQQGSQTGLNISSSSTVRNNLLSGGRRPGSGASTSNQGTSSTIQKKKKDVVRCAECRKRIGVACRYICRCGKTFCSIHRYAEAHVCSFDYKTEGRRQLEEANPLIVASKVDKI